MNKTTIAAIVALFIIFGGIIVAGTYFSKPKVIDYESYDPSKIINATDDNGEIAEHIRGKEDSEVIFVEYADFQCPGCASAMKTVDEIYEEYGDRVAFVFRHFPLSGHPNARSAAAASEAAAKQGYFWEMADALYLNRASWINEVGTGLTDQYIEIFSGLASDLDADKFREDMSDENITKRIDFDYNLGIKISKVEATPALYVNGEAIEVQNATTQDELKEMITEKLDTALAEKGLETGAKKNSKK